jgi:uncharacterized protein (DUF1810 family)
VRAETDLERFVDAQRGVYDDVLDELRAGRKASHWMWFVFPQLRGLGHSPTARYYGIASAAEARAYLAHPVLGPRLRECIERLLALEGRSAHAIFGSPDDLKLRSSLTLFGAVSGDPLFGRALDRFFDGRPDPLTLGRIEPQSPA